jgi:hypothetical protein
MNVGPRAYVSVVDSSRRVTIDSVAGSALLTRYAATAVAGAGVAALAAAAPLK